MSSTPSGIYQIARDDPAVPPAIRRAWPGSSPIVFVRGHWPLDVPALAVIGTTTPVPVARSWAFRLGREGARRGWIVVSGLARGIDAAAHEGALAGGGMTIAVVANGLDSVYPEEHRALADRIVEQGGAIVSIAPPGATVTRERLLLRNQLTSAVSRAVVTVQSRGRGGSLSTMYHAYRRGRLLAACTIPVDGKASEWEGNALLLNESPPWRDRHLQWRPAMPISVPEDLESFFSVLEGLPEPVDDLSTLGETRAGIQPRLLEQRARYRASAPAGESDRADGPWEGEIE